MFGATICMILLNVFLILSHYENNTKTKRSYNTDYLSKRRCDKDAPDFIGHMTTTAFYSVYNAIENKNNKLLLYFWWISVSMGLGKIL